MWNLKYGTNELIYKTRGQDSAKTKQNKTKQKNPSAMKSKKKKKKIQMNLFTKQKQIHRLRKETYGYQRGKVGGRINEKFGINIYTLLYIK